MRTIDDMNGSQPTSASGSINRPIPASPATILVAEFGLAVVTSGTNKVNLEVTVEWQSTLGAAQILFQVIRDTAVVYTVMAQTVAVLETKNTSFTALDINVPIGYHAYKLTAQVVNTSTTASIIGPVTFSGVSYI